MVKIMIVKQRHKNHIIETKSIQIIENILPKEWVIRKFSPDYGIDLSVELFESDSENSFSTLGEYLFIQVKGTESISIINRTLEDGETINVINYQLETTEIATVERIGSALPVLLFIVDVRSERIYFVCLNDYIEKVLWQEDSNFYEKKSKVIYVPVQNCLFADGNLKPLLWYFKRIKIYSLFSLISSNTKTIQYEADNIINISRTAFKKMLRLDIWERRNIWPLLEDVYSEIFYFLDAGVTIDYTKVRNPSMTDMRSVSNCHFEYPYDIAIQINTLQILWERLDNLSDFYEEICKEWWLPTSMGFKSTYTN